MYRVTLEPGDSFEYENTEQLHLAYGRKSKYEQLPNGDILIRHPLNPNRPLLAKLVEGASR